MAERGVDQPVDPLYLRFRMDSIRAGISLTLALGVLGGTYYVETWERPHRTILLTIAAASMAGVVAMSRLPIERVLRGRWREPFFLTWSAATLAVCSAVLIVDGGRSPLATIFFGPMVFATLSYPPRMRLAVGALTIVAYSVAAVVAGGIPAWDVFIVALLLGICGWMCAWQARNQDRQRDELARLSRTDPLTGALNRRGFGERLDTELARVARRGGQLSLLLLDLDGFKAVNDQQGHAAGDALLSRTVAEVRRELRGEDSIGRFGGDEFAVLLPQTGRWAAKEASERLSACLSDCAPVSVGAATFPLDGTTAQGLLRAADAILYEEKARRRTASPATPANPRVSAAKATL